MRAETRPSNAYTLALHEGMAMTPCAQRLRELRQQRRWEKKQTLAPIPATVGCNRESLFQRNPRSLTERPADTIVPESISFFIHKNNYLDPHNDRYITIVPTPHIEEVIMRKIGPVLLLLSTLAIVAGFTAMLTIFKTPYSQWATTKVRALLERDMRYSEELFSISSLFGKATKTEDGWEFKTYSIEHVVGTPRYVLIEEERRHGAVFDGYEAVVRAGGMEYFVVYAPALKNNRDFECFIILSYRQQNAEDGHPFSYIRALCDGKVWSGAHDAFPSTQWSGKFMNSRTGLASRDKEYWQSEFRGILEIIVPILAKHAQ